MELEINNRCLFDLTQLFDYRAKIIIWKDSGKLFARNEKFVPDDDEDDVELFVRIYSFDEESHMWKRL